MDLEEVADYSRFRQAWDSVRIFRSVPYSLFTFGDSDLPYYLVCGPSAERTTALVKRGNVKIARPLIITANNAPPQFQNFFSDQEDDDLVKFLLTRLARFRNMKFDNLVESEQFVSDNVEEVASRIDRTLDEEEEDRVAILTAPAALGSVAVLRYCLERVAESAPDNLAELRERGFLNNLD